MNVQQRVEKLKSQINASIDEYKKFPNKNFLYDFQRYKIMLETILEKYNDEDLQHLLDVELPRLIRNTCQF